MNETLTSQNYDTVQHINFIEIEMQLLSKWTLDIATNVVPENLQCILMRLDQPENRYRIITGLPSDNQRHGIGEVGHLYEPTEKTALVLAIINNKLIDIQDAKYDGRVKYMEKHILFKGIESVVLIPIYYKNAVRWIIAIDKVPPCKPGFSKNELNYLTYQKYWIETYELPAITLNKPFDYGLTSLRGILDQYGHEIRNRLQPIGGYARLIRKRVPQENDKIIEYVTKIIGECEKCETELFVFTKLIVHLFISDEMKEKLPLSIISNRFAKFPEKYVIFDNLGISSCSIFNIKITIESLFDEIDRYIQVCSSLHEITEVIFDKDDYNFFIKIKNKVFQLYKKGMDVRLALFEQIVNKISGKFTFGNSEIIITFPKEINW